MNVEKLDKVDIFLHDFWQYKKQDWSIGVRSSALQPCNFHIALRALSSAQKALVRRA